MQLPRKLKRLLLALAILILFAAALPWPRPSQVIALAPNDRILFVGVTYGTNLVPPDFKTRLLNRLPPVLSNTAKRYLGPGVTLRNPAQTFDQPRLVLWFKRMDTNSHNLMSAIIKLAGPSGPNGLSESLAFLPGQNWSYVSFLSAPRRIRMLQADLDLVFITNRTLAQQTVHLNFRNPLYGRFPQWQPETLPIVKRVGNLGVRLEGIATHDSAFAIGNYSTPAGEPAHNLMFLPTPTGLPPGTRPRNVPVATEFHVSFESTESAKDEWTVHAAELSDATGNALFTCLPFPAVSSGPGFLVGTLWPDEAAWRLKLQVKRARGFTPGELTTFTNLPVPAMGTYIHPGWTNTVGIQLVVLTEFVRYSNPTPVTYPHGGISLEFPGAPPDLAVDILKVTTDSGEVVPITNDQWGVSYRGASFVSIPTNARTVNITIAVQKLRTVEFLVKPPNSP